MKNNGADLRDNPLTCSHLGGPAPEKQARALGGSPSRIKEAMEALTKILESCTKVFLPEPDIIVFVI